MPTWRDKVKPDLICPNRKHIYTVWLFPVAYIVHYVPFTAEEILWTSDRSQPRLQLLFIVWGAFDWTESLMRKWSTMWCQKPFWRKWWICKLWMFRSSKCECCLCFGAHWLIDNLTTNILKRTPEKVQFWFHGTFKDAVVLCDGMSQSLPTLLLHTQKCVLFLHQKSTYFMGVVWVGTLGCSKNERKRTDY